MARNKDGLTLIELMVVMAIFAIVLAIAGSVFTAVVRQSSKQARIAETQMETNIGLQLLRTDVESAGIGLPWAFLAGISYNEAAAGQPSGCGNCADAYNDSPSNIPRALIAADGIGPLNNSDYLVIKASEVALNSSSQAWDYVTAGPPLGKRNWGNLAPTNGVIVIRPSSGETGYRQLVFNKSGKFYDSYGNVPANYSTNIRAGDIIYGIDDNSQLWMPFNRTDYYVKRPTTNMPASCAPNTGILYKAVVNHANGQFTETPVLDCVAAMRVILGFDMNGDGVVGTYSTGWLVSDGSVRTCSSSEGAACADVPNTLNDAALLRSRLREVRIYILAHEGQADPSYVHPNQSINLGPDELDGALSRTFDLNEIGSTWMQYRWKVYTLVAKPQNL